MLSKFFKSRIDKKNKIKYALNMACYEFDECYSCPYFLECSDSPYFSPEVDEFKPLDCVEDIL